MIRYTLRRLISVIPTLIGVTLVIFMFQRLIPGDPAVAMLGEHATEENVARIREQFGLNRPIFLDREALAQGDFKGFFDTQYLRYMGRFWSFSTWGTRSTAASQSPRPWQNVSRPPSSWLCWPC